MDKRFSLDNTEESLREVASNSTGAAFFSMVSQFYGLSGEKQDILLDMMSEVFPQDLGFKFVYKNEVKSALDKNSTWSEAKSKWYSKKSYAKVIDSIWSDCIDCIISRLLPSFVSFGLIESCGVNDNGEPDYRVTLGPDGILSPDYIADKTFSLIESLSGEDSNG